MTMISQHYFGSRPQMLTYCADAILKDLELAIAQRGLARLMISGGNSPKPMYEAMAARDFDWDKVLIAMVDERRVPPTHIASNEAMVRASLIQDKAADATFIGLFNEAPTLELAAAKANATAHYAPMYEGADIVVLGMGADGHIASLFPRAHGLAAALNADSETLIFGLVAEPSAITGANVERLSIGLNTLLHAKQIILLISGEEKRAVYEKAKLCTDIYDMPVAAVLQQTQVPVAVYWAP